MDFSDFSTIEFTAVDSETPEFIYVVFFVQNDVESPFYVGRTKRIWGRMDDYYWPNGSGRTNSKKSSLAATARI